MTITSSLVSFLRWQFNLLLNGAGLRLVSVASSGLLSPDSNNATSHLVLLTVFILNSDSLGLVKLADQLLLLLSQLAQNVVHVVGGTVGQGLQGVTENFVAVDALERGCKHVHGHNKVELIQKRRVVRTLDLICCLDIGV